MIYEKADPTSPIRQGDIFRALPHIFLDPEEYREIVGDRLIKEKRSLADRTQEQPLDVIATITLSYGIVITQDCDLARDKHVSFVQIRPALEVIKATPPVNATQERLDKWWMEVITKKAREEQKWFYLPPDENIGFSEKMAASFQNLIHVRSSYLDKNKSAIRLGRLIPEADEHFREHIAQYFRRYPFNEWYPMTRGEHTVYKREKNITDIEAPPYDWQND